MNIGIDLMFILWLSTFCILLAAIRLSAEIVLKNYRPVHNLLPVKFPKYLNRLQSISVGLALFLSLIHISDKDGFYTPNLCRESQAVRAEREMAEPPALLWRAENQL